jgi:hypothetical protein
MNVVNGVMIPGCLTSMAYASVPAVAVLITLSIKNHE